MPERGWAPRLADGPGAGTRPSLEPRTQLGSPSLSFKFKLPQWRRRGGGKQPGSGGKLVVLLPAAGSGIRDRAVQHRDVTLIPLAVLEKRMLLHYITEWALRRHLSGKATTTYLGDKARQAHY